MWEGFGFSNGTRNIWQLAWLHNWITPGSYHGIKVGFSMIGLIAIYLFYRAAVLYQGRGNPRLLLLMGLFPSILFWSSVLGKDPIMLFGMSLYAYGTTHWFRFRGWRGPAHILVGGAIIALVRLWYLPIVMMPLIVLSLSLDQKPVRKWSLIAISIFGMILSVDFIKSKMEIYSVSDLLDARSSAAGAFQGGGSSLNTAEFDGSIGSLKQVPATTATALFRPLPFEVPNAYGFLQGLDNLFLVTLFLLALLRTKLKEIFEPMILWAITLILGWGVIYGLVTYNFGSLVRYKLQILPVFVILLLYLSRRRATQSKPSPLTICAA
jgi:hypothetical protein